MLARNIKLLRKKLRLTQSAFGEQLGVSRDVISNIEYERVEPKELFVNHICAVFNVRKEWLETGEGGMFQSADHLAENLENAVGLFTKLNPRWQDYALQQLQVFLELQNERDMK